LPGLVAARTPTLAEFGDRVRARRRELGLSQEALAEKTGLHRTYIGSLERGQRNVAVLNILTLCRALETTPGRLLDGLDAQARQQEAGPVEA
jgi:transcriptional regulator with XRE-family HTH domain